MLMTSGTVIVIFWLYMINLQYFFRNISASWPLFILKLDKKNLVLTLKNVPEVLRPIFGRSFGHEGNILSAISCLQYLVHNILFVKSLNIFSSLVVYKRSNFPPSVAWSQLPHPHSGSKSQIPYSRGKGGCQMPVVCPGGGMLRLQIEKPCYSRTSPWHTTPTMRSAVEHLIRSVVQ